MFDNPSAALRTPAPLTGEPVWICEDEVRIKKNGIAICNSVFLLFRCENIRLSAILVLIGDVEVGIGFGGCHSASGGAV